jgi:hypothetical protein
VRGPKRSRAPVGSDPVRSKSRRPLEGGPDPVPSTASPANLAGPDGPISQEMLIALSKLESPQPGGSQTTAEFADAALKSLLGKLPPEHHQAAQAYMTWLRDQAPQLEELMQRPDAKAGDLVESMWGPMIERFMADESQEERAALGAFGKLLAAGFNFAQGKTPDVVLPALDEMVSRLQPLQEEKTLTPEDLLEQVALLIPEFGLQRALAPSPPYALFDKGSADVATNFATRAVATALMQPAEGLRTDKLGNAFHIVRDVQGQEMVVRLLNPTGGGGNRKRQFGHVAKAFGTPVLDAFLVVVARLPHMDEHGQIALNAPMILGERGIPKKVKKAGRKPYTAGYQPEALLEVERSLELLGLIQIERQRMLVPLRKGRPGRPAAELVDVGVTERLLTVRRTRFVRSERVARGAPVPTGWIVEPGSWYREMTQGFAPVAQKLLRYHQQREQWKKHLGVHFTLNMAVNPEGHLRFEAKVGELLSDVGLSFDLRNPMRSWRKLVQALLQLISDHVIGGYRLAVPPGPGFTAGITLDHLNPERLPSELPRRQWGEVVASSRLEIWPPLGQLTHWERLDGQTSLPLKS